MPLRMRVLVTGCSGFLGREIVRQLIDRGDEVIGLSRREVPELVRSGMTHHRGDLTDEAYVRRTIDCVGENASAGGGVDSVVHTAAVAGVWGPWDYFYQNNVVASRHVLNACRDFGVAGLIYTSSPSVTFDGHDQSGINESAGYPSTWLCHYPHTKAIAEREILAADREGDGRLRTLSLRPHLIWGNGDPHLLPRILDRARSGRLRIIGDGNNVIDTVHVINAAAAHVAAVDALANRPDQAAGRAYFITQDEPVRCWDWISGLCQRFDVSPPRKKISYPAAYQIGAALESIYRITRRRGEPPMTRFVAAQLAKDHFFDITAAKERLAYRPILTMKDGLERLS